MRSDDLQADADGDTEGDTKGDTNGDGHEDAVVAAKVEDTNRVDENGG